MHDFKKLIVWQKSVELSVMLYEAIKTFPESEKYGLTSQITRSAVSIASNIAEGTGRECSKVFSNFISIAIESSYELETQIIIAHRIGYINKSNEVFSLIEEIQKMLYKLKSSLNT